jgi:hypothetical protein
MKPALRAAPPGQAFHKKFLQSPTKAAIQWFAPFMAHSTV